MSSKDQTTTEVPVQRGQPPKVRPQVPYLMSVVLYTPSRFVRGVVEAISDDDVFVSTPELLPVDTEVEFHLDLPGGGRTVRGVVQWLRKGRSHQQPSGMGIGFLDLDPVVSEQIQALVRGAASRSGGAKIRIG